MASSDEEGEIVPDCVTNYQFVNSCNAPVSFSKLPLYWSDHESETDNGDSSVVFVIGTMDGGLRSVYKEVIGWKLELSHAVPEMYILSKGKTWIKLQKPRKCYENVVKSVLIVVRFLHFLKRNVDATKGQILSHLEKTLSSFDVVEQPVQKYLSGHLSLIQSAVAKDKDLAKSKYLETFLMGIENSGRREYLHEENQTTNNSKFIVSDDYEEDDDDSNDEAQLLYDSVCAFCDNGGAVLPCEGQCMRSFHPTIDSGAETSCESLGFANEAQYEAIATYLCRNCKHQKHQCFVCGLLGSSDKSSSSIEVFPCVSATCGHFYHPECVANMLHPNDETLAKQLQSQIAAGESFTCPIHKCFRCNLGEDKEVQDMQFAVCRRCPKAYHRKCLPRKIAFEASGDGIIEQRAWDGLLPQRILIYCLKHKIFPDIWTPKRDHLLFPYIVRKRNQEGSVRVMMSERKSKAFGNLEKSGTENKPKVVQRRHNTTITTTYDGIPSKKCKSSSMQEIRPSFEDNEQPSTMALKPVKKKIVVSPPSIDTDVKKRILKIIEDSTSSLDLEEVITEKRNRCTNKIYNPQTRVDKTITMGKVEASVKAVRTALKKLENGGSVEDAKAVCEPNVLNQLMRWKDKLQVFLAPFLHGARYTSYGRHFTKGDKLMEIVERLHWYVKDGDTIVDFCCGSNDFSCFMKEKLESMGKKCLYKNYDLITPKNTFNFEKRDWFSVPVDDLPDGSRLVMGLNPPFGVQASLANKFINHALRFKPKLLILIVPRETKRLDKKWHPYDLIWEEEYMLSGKSFYLPGSIDAQDQPLDDWNVVSPPLSLWSRPDWTSKHKSIAQEQNHIHIQQKPIKPKNQTPVKQKQKQKKEDETIVSNYLMEEKHDCYGDFSTIMPDISNILDDVPSEPDGPHPRGSNFDPAYDDTSDMDLGSLEISPTNSTSGPPLPYGFQYSQPGQYVNYGQMVNPPYPNYDPNYGYPINPTMSLMTPPGPTINYGQPSQTDIWPPGTMPCDRRFG